METLSVVQGTWSSEKESCYASVGLEKHVFIERQLRNQLEMITFHDVVVAPTYCWQDSGGGLQSTPEQQVSLGAGT